jgi:hypothetical protein
VAGEIGKGKGYPIIFHAGTEGSRGIALLFNLGSKMRVSD